jgi:hypothetical protein
MADIIRAITELLRTVGEMAGGRIRGQIAFWVVFTAIVTLCVKPSYESISYVLRQLGVAIELPTLLLAIAMSIISVIMLVGFGAAIGTLLGLFTRFAFASPTRTRIDGILTKLISTLQNASASGIDIQTTNKLVAEAEKLYEQWASSPINKFLKWQRRDKKAGQPIK